MTPFDFLLPILVLFTVSYACYVFLTQYDKTVSKLQQGELQSGDMTLAELSLSVSPEQLLILRILGAMAGFLFGFFAALFFFIAFAITACLAGDVLLLYLDSRHWLAYTADLDLYSVSQAQSLLKRDEMHRIRGLRPFSARLIACFIGPNTSSRLRLTRLKSRKMIFLNIPSLKGV